MCLEPCQFLSPKALTSLLTSSILTPSIHHAVLETTLFFSETFSPSTRCNLGESLRRDPSHSAPSISDKLEAETKGSWSVEGGKAGRRECGFCREARAGLPARTSCSSAASRPGRACTGGPHRQAGPAAPLLGSSGLVSVSTGVTNTHANCLWSQAQDPSPNSMRGQRVVFPGSLHWKALAKRLDRLLGVIAPLAKWKKRAVVESLPGSMENTHQVGGGVPHLVSCGESGAGAEQELSWAGLEE